MQAEYLVEYLVARRTALACSIGAPAFPAPMRASTSTGWR
jgi:hypothetical protein